MATEYSARAGQITVTTAGTAVAGADVEGRKFLLLAPAGNSGEVYVGNDGADDVTASNGFEIPQESPILVQVRRNLKELYFDSASNGDKICWWRVLDNFSQIRGCLIGLIQHGDSLLKSALPVDLSIFNMLNLDIRHKA